MPRDVYVNTVWKFKVLNEANGFRSPSIERAGITLAANKSLMTWPSEEQDIQYVAETSLKEKWEENWKRNTVLTLSMVKRQKEIQRWS